MQELMPKRVAATVPPLYATEDEGDPIARVKLFSSVSAWTWYVTEYDPATGEAFGLVEGFADEPRPADAGYSSCAQPVAGPASPARASMLLRLLSGSAAPAQSGAGEARPKQPVGRTSLPENQRLRLRFPPC